MPRPIQPRAQDHLRSEIAALAAKLIAEEHAYDFASAKRKAARQMGINEGQSLPSNQEVEAALASHRAIYDPQHQHILNALRSKVLALMVFFERFHPYLTGSVLSGIAGEHSDINLILFYDDPKSVEFFLIDQQIDYTHKDTIGAQRFADFPTLSFWYDDTPVLLHVRPLSAERNLAGRELRVSSAEAQRLFAPALEQL